MFKNLRIRLILRFASILSLSACMFAACCAGWGVYKTSGEARRLIMQQAQDSSRGLSSEIRSDRMRAAEAAADRVDSFANTTVAWLVGMGLLSFILTFIVNGVVSKAITKPINDLVQVSKSVSKGDVNVEVPHTEYENELGSLARSFVGMLDYLNEMVAVSESIARGDLKVEVKQRSEHDRLAQAFTTMLVSLRSMVGAISDAASQLNSAAVQVVEASRATAQMTDRSSSAVDTFSTTFEELGANARSVLNSANTQRSTVDETTRLVGVMVASIRQAADGIDEVEKLAAASLAEVKTGTETVRTASSAQAKANASIQKTATVVEMLGEHVSGIGQLVGLLEDIADQINLLALNAAIEAARAGQHGLGFAVVADEVRKLAEQSAGNTKNVTEIIAATQKGSAEGVGHMGQSTQLVADSMQLSEAVAAAFTRIGDAVQNLSRHLRSIDQTSDQQLSETNNLQKAALRMTEATDEIASSVEEQVKSINDVAKPLNDIRNMIRQSSSSSAELAAASDQLVRLAGTLKELVGRFNTVGDAAFGQRRRLAVDVTPNRSRLQAPRRETISV